jgi:tetratricopeptide (TPR) repeat protein
MRRIVSHLILSATLVIHFAKPVMGKESSASLMAQALEKIQAGDKNQALKLLGRAYESSQDPEEIKSIAALIIDTSGTDYPKRENFLVYLTRHARDSADHWKWLKELGDRHFDRGQFDKAEDYYLQAQSKSPEKGLIELKLAFTLWNLRRRNESFLQFLKLSSENQAVEVAALMQQVPASLGKLWWELGPLPQATWSQLMLTPQDFSSTVLDQVFAAFPVTIAPTPKEAALLKQIKDSAETQQRWRAFLSTEVFFSASPCFFFEHLLGEGDFVSHRMLIACVDSKNFPSGLNLDSFFETALNQSNDENLVRAYLKYLTQRSRPVEAASKALQWQGLSNASKSFVTSVHDLLLSLSEADWKLLYPSADASALEVIVRAHPKSSLLEILQSLDSERWIRFEEGLYPQDQTPRSVIMKRTILLASQSEPNLNALRTQASTLLTKPQNASERSAQKILKAFEKVQSQEFPKVLSDDFNQMMNRVIRDLDSQVAATANLPAQWFKVMHPLVGEEIRKSVDQLISQIDALELPAEASGIEEAFYQKKEEMKANLRAKYREFFPSPGSSRSLP